MKIRRIATCLLAGAVLAAGSAAAQPPGRLAPSLPVREEREPSTPFWQRWFPERRTDSNDTQPAPAAKAPVIDAAPPRETPRAPAPPAIIPAAPTQFPQPVPPPREQVSPRPDVREPPPSSFAWPAAEGFSTWREGTDTVLGWLHGHLEIGTRTTSFDLKSKSRPPDPTQETTFLGNINQLEDDQNADPTKLFVDVMVNRYAGIEWTHDTVAARTRNWNNGQSDGVLEMSGHILMLLGRYPIQDRFIPYVGIGYAWMKASFDTENWWALGWGSPEEFTAAGGEPSPFDIRRYVDVGDDRGTAYVAGLVFKFHEHGAIDLMVRSIDVSADARFYRTIHDVVDRPKTITGEFPMKHTTYGLGIRYVF